MMSSIITVSRLKSETFKASLSLFSLEFATQVNDMSKTKHAFGTSLLPSLTWDSTACKAM